MQDLVKPGVSLLGVQEMVEVLESELRCLLRLGGPGNSEPGIRTILWLMKKLYSYILYTNHPLIFFFMVVDSWVVLWASGEKI